MAGRCQPAMDDLIAFNTPPRNTHQSIGLNTARYPLARPVASRCPVDQILDWSPEMDRNRNWNVDDLLSYSPPPLRQPNLNMQDQPGIVHNLAQIHPDIRVHSPSPCPSPRMQTPTRYAPIYGPLCQPPEIEIQSPDSPPCQEEQCTPIACVDKVVRYKSNILGGDEENRARWTDIQSKFSFLKNSFDNLYSGLFLNISGVRPPNQPWALRPEPQKCTYEDSFREYPSDILDFYLDNWSEIIDDESDLGQDFTLWGEDNCDIQIENIEGNLNMGTCLQYEDEDKGDGEVNVSVKVMESKCTDAADESSGNNDESDEDYCAGAQDSPEEFENACGFESRPDSSVCNQRNLPRQSYDPNFIPKYSIPDLPKPEIDDDVDPYQAKILEELLLQHRLKANPPPKTPPVKKAPPPKRGLKKWEPTLPSRLNKAVPQPAARGSACPPRPGTSARPPIKTTGIKPPLRTAATCRPQTAATQKMVPPSSRPPPRTAAPCRPQVAGSQRMGPPPSRPPATKPPLTSRLPSTKPSQSRLNPRAEVGIKPSASTTSAGRAPTCPTKAPTISSTAKGGARPKTAWR